ncbi:MAG: cryptochrome/photolyase family protein [Candidatus Poseidoniales archaeon]
MGSALLSLPAGTTSAAGRTGAFGKALSEVVSGDAETWVWLSYDQLNVAFLESIVSQSVGVVLIESSQKARRRPYHQQKLGVLLSNQRHFALELQAAGIPVLYLMSDAGYGTVLQHLGESFGPLHCFTHAERELRMEVDSAIASGILIEHPHPGWLTPRSWFVESVGTEPPFRMDAFYRKVRQQTGWMMEQGKPVGGKYSYDAENRFPWKGEPPAPEVPLYGKDMIDDEVETLIRARYGEHPGRIDLTTQPTSEEELEQALRFAMDCLPNFGTYEDAMSEKSRGLFHSRLATLVNLHRVMPARIVESALSSEAPINSVEGFVRQMIWREYVHHIHDVTDGFRTLDVKRSTTVRGAGWDGFGSEDRDDHPDHLQQGHALPMAYWGETSGLRCLDASVQSVMEDGWTHHIPRLMVLSNVANLLDINPRQLTDWFHAAFIDAYDWVVEPNVLGMGTFALGTAMMTKPYVAGSAYINRMSDHCKSCQFHHKKTCPMTRLYWAYLNRHADAFSGNHRMAIAMKNVARRADEEKALDAATFEHVRATLAAGQEVRPPEGDLRSWS